LLKREYDSEKKHIAALIKESPSEAVYLAEALIESLFATKKYKWIVDLFESPIFLEKPQLYSFELAFSLNNVGKSDEAGVVYEELLEYEPNNSSILNNLHLIYKKQGNRAKAWPLIKAAYGIAPEDSTIETNYKSLLSEIQEAEEQEAIFEAAVEKVSKENSFVLEKLSNFLLAAKGDENFSDGCIPIPRWKLKVMMKTDEQKSLSLINQWIDKGYVSKTGNRGQYGEAVYRINPKIFPAMEMDTTTKLPDVWITGINRINQENLIDMGFFEAMKKIANVDKDFRNEIERDVNELFLNVIFRNSKSIIVLSGSLTEMLLIYHLHKMGLSEIEYEIDSKKKKKKLLDCTIFDLINVCEQRNFLKAITVNLGHVSRLYRNYIHPGKEIKDDNKLDFNKATLCYSATLEILHTVLN